MVNVLAYHSISISGVSPVFRCIIQLDEVQSFRDASRVKAKANVAANPYLVEAALPGSYPYMLVNHAFSNLLCKLVMHYLKLFKLS